MSVDGLTVAVGGQRSSGYTISTTTNDGLDWTHQRWTGSTNWEGLEDIVHERGLWLIRGSSGTLPRMMRSDNGLDWEPGTLGQHSITSRWYEWVDFGPMTMDSSEQDGLTWNQVHTLSRTTARMDSPLNPGRHHEPLFLLWACTSSPPQ